MKIAIDPNSGFCFGVVYAIKAAEEELEKSGILYCLGDIVHNNKEVERLLKKGLKIINHEDLKHIYNSKVLIRAHGEPPGTYETAIANNIELIDASCPVVLRLQNSIKNGFNEMNIKDGQIVILGKEGHAEVNGLVGQTLHNAIIINHLSDIEKIDYSKPIRLFSQTTQNTSDYEKIICGIEENLKKANKDPDFIAYNTICKQVSNREPQLKAFASSYDVVIFVSGKKSSNGLSLFSVCKTVNQNTYFISDVSELNKDWFKDIHSVGICGATSTPMWLMQDIATAVKQLSD